MKYNSIGEQLIAKAQELDPSYKPDKFNDMSEAINIILNNSGRGDNLTFPATSPSSQVIPSITTANEQQNLTVGDGLAIKNGALTSTLSNFKYGTLCLNNITQGDATLNIELSFFDYIYDAIVSGANQLLGTSLTRNTFPQYILSKINQ